MQKQDCPCGRKCIVEKHSDCKDLLEIENNIRYVKSSEREKVRIENEIVQTRIKINSHLDKLLADLIHEIYAKEARENEQIKQVLQSLEKMRDK